ncbi:hypothetical protein [Sphingomonas psychrotolerans]|uniref:Uncharacterized protein n=1 Tax=Sphingomonas psychrotolerans TaxID=1327635 RepID=A0A2K8MDI0_9SPHN|nr:hypothetical protein [Sphingomonas psychrotolerans]ATY31952.1 hypothetical protein CVN68_08190 [Sphingomonas psychrotolerans]
MKLQETARAIWLKFEALASALDYDPYADIISRFERLERDGQSRQAELTALSGEVLNLSEQPRRESCPPH